MITSTVHNQEGKKVTPTQLAKEAIADRMDLLEYFMEGHSEIWDAMTDREQVAFNEACARKWTAVMRYLGCDCKGRKL